MLLDTYFWVRRHSKEASEVGLPWGPGLERREMGSGREVQVGLSGYGTVK